MSDDEGSPLPEVPQDVEEEDIPAGSHRHATPAAERHLSRLDHLEASGQALRVLLHAWKRLLGMTACGQLAALGGRPPAPPSIGRRLCSVLWALLLMLVAVASVGLQWARCQRVYLERLMPSEGPEHNNGTDEDYVCVHSFVWTYMLPRLAYVLGYIAVFVCWFCLKQPDLIRVVGEVYDTVMDRAEYAPVSDMFLRFCRSDRRLLVGLLFLAAALSTVSALFGGGIVHFRDLIGEDATPQPPRHMAAITVAAEVFSFITTFVIDNVMLFCLVSYTMSLKYLDLILMKTQTHLDNARQEADLSPACYVKPQYMRGHRLMTQFQACISAVVLLVLLRVCQGVTLIALDLTSEKPRTESLALLPVILTYTVILCYYIYRCCRLSADGLAHHQRYLGGGPEAGASGTDESALVQPATGRGGAQWLAELRASPPVSGRLFGLSAAWWMFAVLALVTLCYCAGYYALERFWPLI